MGNESTPSYSDLLSAQVESLTRQGRWWEAGQLLRERIRWLDRHDPGNRVALGEGYLDLARLSQAPYRASVFKAHFRQAQRLLEPAYRTGTPTREAATRAMAAWAASDNWTRDSGKWDECRLRAEWLAYSEEAFGMRSPRLVEPLLGLASHCEEEAAETRELLYGRAKALARQVEESEPSLLLEVLEQQGTYLASSEDSEARQRLGEGILTDMRRLRAQVYVNAPLKLAVLELHDRAFEKPEICRRFASGSCRSYFEQRLDTLEASWGVDHPALAAVRLHLAEHLGGLSQDSDSDSAAMERFVGLQYRLALSSATASLGADHPQTGRIAEQAGNYFGWRLGRRDQGAEFYGIAVTAYAKHFGRNDDATAEASRNLRRLQGRQ